eukprot:15102446-Alexandrium_andersonii.AAC.1
MKASLDSSVGRMAFRLGSETGKGLPMAGEGVQFKRALPALPTKLHSLTSMSNCPHRWADFCTASL